MNGMSTLMAQGSFQWILIGNPDDGRTDLVITVSV